jgi:4-hydroxy-3-methylbut-2-enyl diphosphate reductase
VDRLSALGAVFVHEASDDICYAAQNRQAAVRQIAAVSGVVLVVGSANSHNSRCLVEVAEQHGTPAYLIDDEHGINPAWLSNLDTVGLTGGASAPPGQIDRVLAALAAVGYTEVVMAAAAHESPVFALSRELETA